MGTVHEFPLWRTQRSPPPDCAIEAQIVMFPGVRIERDDAHPESAGSDNVRNNSGTS